MRMCRSCCGPCGQICVTISYCNFFFPGATLSAILGGATVSTCTADGSVLSVNVTAGGSGYTSAPTVSFSGGGGTGAAGTAVINAGTHVVTGVTMTNAGSGYTSRPAVSFSGGAGTGATGLANMQSKCCLPINATGTYTIGAAFPAPYTARMLTTLGPVVVGTCSGATVVNATFPSILGATFTCCPAGSATIQPAGPYPLRLFITDANGTWTAQFFSSNPATFPAGGPGWYVIATATKANTYDLAANNCASRTVTYGLDVRCSTLDPGGTQTFTVQQIWINPLGLGHTCAGGAQPDFQTGGIAGGGTTSNTQTFTVNKTPPFVGSAAFPANIGGPTFLPLPAPGAATISE